MIEKEEDIMTKPVTEISHKELTLNLEHQGYEFASKVSNTLENVTRFLIKKNII